MNILIIYPNGNALNPHSGAETRIWNLNSALINRDFNVTILHSAEAKGFEDPKLLEKSNVHYVRKLGNFSFYLSDFNPFFIIKLFKILKKKKFDIIQIEFPWGFFMTKLLKNRKTILIYDSQGVEGEFMKVAIENPKFPVFLKPLAKVFGKLYEKNVCKLADIIINVSEIDRDYYINKYKILKNKTILIQTPSSLIADGVRRTDDLKMKCRKKLNLPLDKTIVVFHGGLPHPPNQEAFDLIKNYISPKINNPDIIFVLAGHNLKKFKENNIISLGFVENLKDFLFSADFAIVPLINGSGMRIKITDYIITALPFISTQNGIEGIDFVKNGEDFLLYQTVNEDFLEGINLLYRDKELMRNLHENLLKKSNKLNRIKFENKFLRLFSYLKKD